MALVPFDAEKRKDGEWSLFKLSDIDFITQNSTLILPFPPTFLGIKRTFGLRGKRLASSDCIPTPPQFGQIRPQKSQRLQYQ